MGPEISNESRCSCPSEVAAGVHDVIVPAVRSVLEYLNDFSEVVFVRFFSGTCLSSGDIDHEANEVSFDRVGRLTESEKRVG